MRASARPADEVVLSRRQLYILPTRFGWLFSFVLLVMLLAAINYGNALAFGLAFWLAALGVVSMLYTHRNLLGLRVAHGACVPVFVGERAEFPLCLSDERGESRRAVCLETGKTRIGRVDVVGYGQTRVQLAVPARRRGYLRAPPVVVSTQFPIGVLYAWSRRIHLNGRCLVYPRPQRFVPTPVGVDTQAHQDRGTRPEGDDFRGLREFRPGDSPRHVSWKAVARGRGMLTKQFGGAYRASIWLDWETLPGLEAEQRLSQLCQWVLDCEHAGLQYGLRLPGTSVRPASGERHRHRCLAALALFAG